MSVKRGKRDESTMFILNSERLADVGHNGLLSDPAPLSGDALLAATTTQLLCSGLTIDDIALGPHPWLNGSNLVAGSKGIKGGPKW